MTILADRTASPPAPAAAAMPSPPASRSPPPSADSSSTDSSSSSSKGSSSEPSSSEDPSLTPSTPSSTSSTSSASSPPPPPSPPGLPDSANSSPRPASPSTSPPFPQPKLRLEMRDLHHEGAGVFLQAVNAAAVLDTAVGNVQRLLYGLSRGGGGGGPSADGERPKPDPDTHMPPTRSVTVILRDMPGVAYTTGSELDSDHKEIHFSLGYVAGIQPRSTRAAAEITGVLTHELVHCYQWNGRGSCPGGLVEGIADWVRLRSGLVPPHWKRAPSANGRWDAGYQTTAYFLDYLEGRFGDGTVRRINEALRQQRYDGAVFWPALLGHAVADLWQDYVNAVAGGEGDLPKSSVN